MTAIDIFQIVTLVYFLVIAPVLIIRDVRKKGAGS